MRVITNGIRADPRPQCESLFGPVRGVYVGIESLKVRHDVTKLDLTIPLLSFWCVDIDMSIQPMSLTLYKTVCIKSYTKNISWVSYK